MLSQLSRGYGSWVAGYVDPTYGEKKGHHDREHTSLGLPEIDQDSHFHGVTVGSRSGRSTALSYATTKRTKDTHTTHADSGHIPKTYTTRKGALQLYVAPSDDEDESDEEAEQDGYALHPKYSQIRRPAGQELIDLSLKLGTMGRLAMSVLNFGDQDYDKEHASITDDKNKAFLKFLHSIDNQKIPDPSVDETLRPGGDLNTYLRELRSSSSMKNYGHSSTYVPKNREFLELQALLRGLDNNSWPLSYQQDGFSDRQSSGQFTRPVSRVSSQGGTPGPPSTPKSSYKVLSSKQLTASLKSSNYLGRPSSQFSVNDDDDIQSDVDYSLRNVKSAGFPKKPWTPDSSTDELLIDKFFKGSSEDWETEEGNKRRRFKERSVLAGSEVLYQGRNSQNGEGYQNDLKFKGEGYAQSKGQTMNQITEEVQEESKRGKYAVEDDEMSEEESDVTGQWAEHVTRVQHTITKVKDDLIKDTLTDNNKQTKETPKSIDIEMPPVLESDKGPKKSGPRSNVSDSSSSSISSLKHVPTVVSLQSFRAHKPVTPPDRNSLLYKRRKSLSAAIAFDPERLKNAIQGPRRRPNSSHAEKTRPFLMKGETTERQPRQIASNYSLKPTATYWSINGVETLPTASDKTGALDDNKSDIDITADQIKQAHEANSDSSQGKVDQTEMYIEYDDGVLKEDALLRDIKECNDEIEQIEANADAVVDDTDTDSDSGTYVDEEIIRELIEAEENEKERLMSGHGHKINHVDETVEDDNDDIQARPESSVKRDMTEDVEEVDGEDIGNDVEMETGDINEGKENTEDSVKVDEVNDEIQSEITSRSSRKLRSKLSSKLSSGDGESNENVSDDVMSDYRRDTEVPQAIQDDQTAFSGSTGSYSDLLAGEKHSRPTSGSVKGLEIESDLIVDDGGKVKEENELVGKADEMETELDGSLQTVTGAVDNEEEERVTAEGNQSTSDPSQEVIANHDQDQIVNKIVEHDSIVESVVENAEGNHDENDAEIKVLIKDKTEEIETEPRKDEVIDENNLSNTKEEPTTNTPTEEATLDKTKLDKNKTEISGIKTDRKTELNKQSVRPTSPKTSSKTPTKRIDTKPTRASVRKNSTVRVDRTKSPLQHAKTVAGLGTSRLEGTGMVQAKSEALSSVEGIVAGANDTESDGDVLDQVPESGTISSITDELDALGLSKAVSTGKKKSIKTDYPLFPPGKRPKAPAEKMKIPDHLKEAMDRKSMRSYENLEKDLERMTALVDESLSGPTMEAVGEGLTEEELEMAKQMLQRKIEEAKQQLDGKDTKARVQKKKPQAKGQKKGKKKKGEDDRTEEEIQRDAMREKQALEKQRRDEEVKELQRKIAERKKLLQEQDDSASAKATELREQMERLEQEADDLQRAEDEARDMLSEVRKKQREERDVRRKADLERRKQDALYRREKEKKELEDKKKKEMEMMEKIADGEMRRRLREEEERKSYEEDRLAQERYEEELREAQRMEEEEEERMREMERQAEEEAMQRLIDEREKAERERRQLMEKEEIMMEEENRKREIMMIEEERLAAERRKIEEEEQRKRQLDMDRLMELRRAEDEARQRLQEEVEKRRSEALARRDFNLENKQSVDKLRHHQGITRAWTFSYFVKWPRETYESQTRRSLRDGRRPIGDADPRKVVKINNPAPKKAEAPQETTDNPTEPTPQ